MSDNKATFIGVWSFPLFIAAKLAGPCAAWSWWWLLAPIIPVLTEIIKYAMVLAEIIKYLISR